MPIFHVREDYGASSRAAYIIRRRGNTVPDSLASQAPGVFDLTWTRGGGDGRSRGRSAKPIDYHEPARSGLVLWDPPALSSILGRSDEADNLRRGT